jgi:putative transposase
MCSGCGNVKANLTLQDRQYHCDACGIAMDRDINAAINIRRLGTSLATDKTVSEAHDFSHE